jgi:hypothetical protein
MPLRKLSLGGKYDVTYKLFLPRESLVSDIPARDRNIYKTLTILFYIHRVHEILLDHVTIQNKRGTKILDFHSVSTVISSYALLVGRKRTPTIWDL